MGHLFNALLLALGFFDWGITTIALTVGFAHEANPVMAPLWGTPWFHIVKLGAHSLIFLVVCRALGREYKKSQPLLYDGLVALLVIITTFYIYAAWNNILVVIEYTSAGGSIL